MRYAFLLILLAAGCSVPAHHTYERGTFVRPPPAPTRPGVGAPVLGQPGQAGPLPRSPHARVLPPTKEPGLWSGDTVRASATHGVPEIAKVPILIPPSDDDPQPLANRGCADRVTTLLEKFKLLDRLISIREDFRACIVATMYADCIESEEVAAKAMADFHQKLLRPRRIPSIEHVKDKDQAKAERAAKRFTDEACKPDGALFRNEYVTRVRDALLSEARNVK